jgi:hypothetical protein
MAMVAIEFTLEAIQIPSDRSEHLQGAPTARRRRQPRLLPALPHRNRQLPPLRLRPQRVNEQCDVHAAPSQNGAPSSPVRTTIPLSAAETLFSIAGITRNRLQL